MGYPRRWPEVHPALHRPMRQTSASSTLALALTTVLFVAAPAELSGQYFGSNKVVYESFDWRVLNTPHFDLHFYPEEEEPARDAGRMLERWYQRQSSLLRNEFTKKPVILYSIIRLQHTTSSAERSRGTGA